MSLTFSQVTTIEADAADEKAISGVCDQALREEGRLDVFFANVHSPTATFSFHAHNTVSGRMGIERRAGRYFG